jgi:ABC-2 type transport system permease protein
MEINLMTLTNNTLQTVRAQGWQRGFGNLLEKENTLHWGGRRWIVPALVWLAILNGFILLIAYGMQQDDSLTISQIVPQALEVFLNIAVLASAVGAVIGAQGTIIREKQLGTAAWILSKPASRGGFVLAKLVAYTFTAVTLSLAVPALVYYVESQFLWQQIPAVVPFILGWLVMALSLVFYVAFTLMLGTLFNSRGPVAGIGLGFLFAGQLLPNFLPQWMTVVGPWMLKDVAVGLAMGVALPSIWPVPVISTVVLTVVCVGIALWRFGREEF